jgi:hypothetical protein
MEFLQGWRIPLCTACFFYKEIVGTLREANSLGKKARHFRQKVDSAD